MKSSPGLSQGVVHMPNKSVVPIEDDPEQPEPMFDAQQVSIHRDAEVSESTPDGQIGLPRESKKYHQHGLPLTGEQLLSTKIGIQASQMGIQPDARSVAADTVNRGVISKLHRSDELVERQVMQENIEDNR